MADANCLLVPASAATVRWWNASPGRYRAVAYTSDLGLGLREVLLAPCQRDVHEGDENRDLHQRSDHCRKRCSVRNPESGDGHGDRESAPTRRLMKNVIVNMATK